MANEYLTRTPTSTGNRRVFTISFWTKNNVAGGHYFQQRENANSTTQFGISHRTPEDYLRVLMNDGGDVESLSDCLAEMRDFSSWQNIIVAVNTTIPLAEDRVIIYVDGVRRTDFNSDSHSDNPAENFLTSVNDTVRALIGLQRPNSSATLNNSVTAQLTDYFLIDGQALTPDVFGFYKEGKGYQSSGTIRATDFRPGQWVPKKPSVIKNSINKSGGFGVNGFYMPMNDSSNFGADFHCDPNTIITLQDETAAQPKNGAPTTTDSYVSQLRSDPYADNLVLAIPGITGGQGSGYGDYHADIKGSGSNKTVTSNSNAGVAITASYYGSALIFDGVDDYFTIPANDTDFQFGSGDFTVECWVNPNTVSAAGGFIGVWNSSDNRRSWILYHNASASYNLALSSTGSTGDLSLDGFTVSTTNQWHHVVGEREGSIARLYVNGVVVGIKTDLGTTSLYTNTQDTFAIGTWNNTNNNDNTFDGYIQDIRIYKGVAKYKGGFDVSKPYTPVGIATWREVPDCTANNFASLNSNSGDESSGQFTLTDGNLTATTTNSNTSVTSNVGMSTGKWYWEYSPTQIQNFHDIGISSMTNPPLGFDDGSISASWRTSTGQIRQGNTDVQATGLSASAGDIVQIAFNASTRRMWVGINGSYYNNGDPAAGTDSTYQTNLTADTYFFAASMHGSGTSSGVANYGQNPTFSGNVSVSSTQRNADDNGKGQFRYAPPSGFLALCEDNLPTPEIVDPGDYFKCVLWTGNGSARGITGVGFKPDFVWIKNRDSTYQHQVYDSVRGAGQKLLPSTTNAESTDTANVSSFDSDGFSFAGGNVGVNENAVEHVAWCWKAGAGTTSLNTDGSINSVVSVNQDAGFSIATYTTPGTATNFGHGLGKKPAFAIFKARTDTGNWAVYHQSLGTNTIRLSTDGAQDTSADAFNDTEPTDTLMYLGTWAGTNNANINWIAYLWAEIEGFSKFGSYIGNGDADGPFVHLGFKPAWVMVKSTSSSEPWAIYDNSRGSTNPNSKGLYANDNTAENDASGRHKDFLSNGFKPRGTSGEQNSDGVTYIFAAFAESPFKTANAK